MGQGIYRLISLLVVLTGFLATGVDRAAADQAQPPQFNYSIPPYYLKKPAVLPPAQKIPPSAPKPQIIPPNTGVAQNPVYSPPQPVVQGPGQENPLPGNPTPETPSPGNPPAQTQNPGAALGSGGGAPPVSGAAAQLPPAGNMTVNAGVITVEPITGGLTFAADSGKLFGLAAQAKEKKQGRIILSLLNPGGAPVSQYQALIPLDALKVVSTAQQKLVIATEGASLSLPPAVLKELPQGASSGELRLILQPASGKDSQNISQTAGETLEVSFWVKGKDGKSKKIDSFSNPVSLSLKYDPQIPTDKLSRLGVYRLNDQTGAWVYVGGKVNAAEGVISIDRKSFSTYSVRLYEEGYIDLVGHWARTDVEQLASQGLVKGLSELTYGPDRKITRAEFAALLQRALNLPDSKTARFKDIRAEDWYAGGVAGAAQAGLVTGNPNGTFNPNNSITRQEMAVMLARALARHKPAKITGDPLLAFSDRNRMAFWAQEKLAIAVQAGLIKGQTSNRFGPEESATRAEAAVMLKRLMNNLN